jgi:hypothetical protein
MRRFIVDWLVAWRITAILANQNDKVVGLKTRFKNAPQPNAQGGLIETFLLTVGCTNCIMINEPWPWNKKWISTKFILTRTLHHGVLLFCLLQSNLPGTFSNATHQMKAITIGISKDNPLAD